MKNIDKKKIIIIVAIILVVALGVLLAFVVFGNGDDEVEPIPQESISSTDEEEIETRSLQIDEEEEYRIWGISNKLSLNEIEEMIYKLGLNVSLVHKEEGLSYRWEDEEGNSFHYSVLSGSLVFILKDGISWDEFVLTHNSFSKFVAQYFDLKWDYELVETVPSATGGKYYYAKRLTDDGVVIEKSPVTYRETDSLYLENGRIVSGEIFLIRLLDIGIEVPLLAQEELSEYVNQKGYPKKIDISIDELVSVLSIDIENREEVYAYLSDEEIISLPDKVENCKAVNYSVVYLYKNFDQTFLTPVYKLILDCSIEYEGLEYSVPAVAYVNAIDPQYIVVPE